MTDEFGGILLDEPPSTGVDEFGGVLLGEQSSQTDEFGGIALDEPPSIIDQMNEGMQSPEFAQSTPEQQQQFLDLHAQWNASEKRNEYDQIKSGLEQQAHSRAASAIEMGNDGVPFIDEHRYQDLVPGMKERANRLINENVAGRDFLAEGYAKDLDDTGESESWAARTALQTTAGIGATLKSFFSRITGDQDEADRAEQGMAHLEQGIDERQANDFQRMATGAASSLGKAAYAGAAGGPAGMIGTFMYDAGSRAYAETGDVSYALSTGLIEGGITAAFQRAGLGGLEKGIKGFRGAGLDGLKKFGKQLLAEVGEEEAIGLAQAFNSQMQGVDPEALSKFPDQALQIAGQTLLTMGAAKGMVQATDFLNKPSRKTARDAGVDQIATNHKERTDLASKVKNALTVNQLREQLQVLADDGKITPEQARYTFYSLEARAKGLGESVDQYIARRLKGVESTTRKAAETQLGQSFPEGRRGQFVPLEDGRAIIQIFETGHFGTVVHEFGHLFEQDLQGQDKATVEKWLGVTDGEWSKKQKEQWARGYERYKRDGKAPTPALTRLYDKFNKWMGEIYKSVAGSPIDVDIPPDVREVFDRMFLPAEQPSQPTEAAAEIPPVAEEVLAQAPQGTPTAAKNVMTSADLEAMGLDPTIQRGPRRPWAQVEAEAIAKRMPEQAMGLAAEVHRDPSRMLKDVEEAGMVLHAKFLKDQYAAVQEDLNNATLDEATIKTRAAEAERLEQDLETLDHALQRGGTPIGQALAFRKWIKVGQDFSALAVVNRGTQKKGKKLTAQEKRKLNQAAKEHEEAEKKLAEAEAKQETEKKTRQKKLKTEADKLREKIEKAPLPKDLNKYARDLAKQFLAEGVISRRELIDKVQKAVREVFPDTQRRQVIDAISGYGDFTQLSKDDVSVRLRDLKGQLQQIGKLKDMAEGVAPKKTGMERRDPSDTERGLIKEVNEAKKEGGYEVTDPAKQLASALSTIKTRLTNQIKDLQSQIDSRERLIKKKRVPPSDEETKRLTEERDVLKAQFEEIFGKTELTDEQRIAIAEKAVKKSIAGYERRLAAGDFSPRPKSKTPITQNLQVMRDKAAALRKKYAETNPNPPALEAAKERLAVLEEHLKNGTVPTTLPRSEQKNPALKALSEQIAETRKQIREGEPAQKERLRKTLAELQAKLEAGNFALPEGKAPPISSDIERLEFERDRLRRKIRQEVHALKPMRPRDYLLAPLHLWRQWAVSGDLPPVFRQGLIQSSAHPVIAAKATVEGLKSALSEQHFWGIQKNLNERDNAPLYARAGLYLADPYGSPSAREESFIGDLAHKIPGIKHFVEFSDRGMTAFLNVLRADAFDAISEGMARNGEPTMEEARRIASYVNVGSGRGDFSGDRSRTLADLAAVFWSPRYVLSRFQWIFGQPLYGGTAATRKAIGKEYAKTLTAIAIIYLLADELDLLEDGKIKVGDTRLDPFGGLVQTAKFTHRSAKGIKETVHSWFGGPEHKPTYAERRQMEQFLRSKLSPGPGMLYDLKLGRDYNDDKVTPKSLAKNFAPLSLRDISRATEEQGVPAGVALWLVSLFGVGMQTYNKKR
jgi:hypothetical protein